MPRLSVHSAEFRDAKRAYESDLRSMQHATGNLRDYSEAECRALVRNLRASTSEYVRALRKAGYVQQDIDIVKSQSATASQNFGDAVVPEARPTYIQVLSDIHAAGPRLNSNLALRRSLLDRLNAAWRDYERFLRTSAGSSVQESAAAHYYELRDVRLVMPRNRSRSRRRNSPRPSGRILVVDPDGDYYV